MKLKVVKSRRLTMALILFSSLLVFALSFHSASGVVYPQGEPVADAGSNQSVNLGELVTFDGSNSYDPNGYIASYFWDFGDEESEFINSIETNVRCTGTGINPTHTYNIEGTYTATLTVTDDEGLTDTDTMTVTVGTDSKDESTLPILTIATFLTTVALGILILFVLTRKK